MAKKKYVGLMLSAELLDVINKRALSENRNRSNMVETMLLRSFDADVEPTVRCRMSSGKVARG
jgi:hypothetical protein